MEASTEKSNFIEIKPFIRFFQIVGLQYFPFGESSKKSRRFEAKFLIYFLVLAGITSFGFFLLIVRAPHVVNEDTKKSAVQKSITKMLYYGFILSAGVSLYQSITNTSENIEMFKKFEQIADLSLSRAFYKIDYKDFKKHVKVKILGIIFAFTFFLVVVRILDKFSKRLENKPNNPIFTTIPLFLVKFVSVKFIFYVELINFNLKSVQKVLINPCINVLKIDEVVVDLNTTKSYALIRSKDDNLAETLSVAKQMYGLVYECTRLVNCCFGWTLLALYIFITMGLIVILNNMFTFLQIEESWTKFTGK